MLDTNFRVDFRKTPSVDEFISDIFLLFSPNQFTYLIKAYFKTNVVAAQRVGGVYKSLLVRN